MDKSIVEDGANGSIEEVLISPVGMFVGSDREGNPVPQNITEEALTTIANELNESGKEVLLDQDHQSARPGLDRNTKALGWFSKFVANAKGLFGLLRLTKSGRESIGGREYRSVSPVFTLNSNGEPTSLLSVAATNTPAMAVEENTILNQSNDEEIQMTKEEVKQMIDESVKSAIEAMKPVWEDATTTINQEPENVSKTDEKEEQEDVVKTDEPVVAENKCVKDETPVVENNEVVEEPAKTDEPKAEPEVVEEVVTEEVINQAPAPGEPKCEWANLHGDEFFKWCSANPERVSSGH